MRRLLNAAAGEAFPAHRVAGIKMGTTVATNALLERKGARTLLVTTRGFADALLIGDQARPDLFVLDIVRPAPLHAGVVERNPQRHLHVGGRELHHALFGAQQHVGQHGDGSLAGCCTRGHREAGSEFIAGAGQAHGVSVPDARGPGRTPQKQRVTKYFFFQRRRG